MEKYSQWAAELEEEAEALKHRLDGIDAQMAELQEVRDRIHGLLYNARKAIEHLDTLAQLVHQAEGIQ